ncbi:NACHT domain-containing NTPase [Allokutzneria sp. NRRL B-24872]|uniref:NACHT domain-containing protein n=1 Tax=Allokutzneria sp. NRRL B-24872 TaxID=1137961 RepID=UPI0011783681|nr:hypothetical protein [Allokutzneria sp. NRRL B-24872]
MRENTSGDVFGNLVQARDIHGDVHLHQGPASVARQRLQHALSAAVVTVDGCRGVAVEPGVALVCGPGGVVFVDVEAQAFACLHPELLPGDELVRLDAEPGAPVLNLRTGGVCALVGPDGPLRVPEVRGGQREWLDLLEPEQLRAGGWRHVGPQLRGYLDAVRKADRDHPYPSVRHAAPPLSKIYLTRQATRQAEDGEEEALERVDADSLLERHAGVQVLGYPGAGKSSLVRHIAATTAQRWLAEGEGAFVPVPITADVLTQDRTLPDALADGVVRGLSHGLDRNALLELFRAEPLPGVPWLVLVDGLDEVLEPAARHAVLRKVADHRENPAYRFLVTSRPLDGRGLITSAQFPTYVIEPFTDTELHTFVVGWLSAREFADPARAAADFVARVRRTKLYELAHVPLISTMLCLLFAEKPDADLPDNQSQLYREFVSWLVVKLREADARRQLRERVAPYGPSAEAAADALLERIQDLFQDMAFGHQQPGDDRTLLEHALAWRGVEPPVNVPPQEWAEVIADALRISGLVVQRRDWRFLHQTVEEYFAACHLAARHPDPRSWSSRKLLAPQRQWPWPQLEVMVFLVARWVEAGQDVDRKLLRLLGWRHREHNIGFVAQLIRSGVSVGERVRARAVALLTKELSKMDTERKRWHDCAGWLRDIDSRLASREVELVVGSSAPEHRRFDAIRWLLTVDPAPGVLLGLRFLVNTKNGATARKGVADQLAELDLNLARSLFSRVAQREERDAVRLKAAELLKGVDEELAAETFAKLAEYPDAEVATRLLAAREAWEAHRDVDRTFSVLAELLATRGPEWGSTADFAVSVSALRAEKLLRGLADTDQHGRNLQLEAALFLSERMAFDEKQLVRLAKDRQLDRTLRMRAAEEVQPAVAAEILRKIADECRAGDAYLFTVLQKLEQVDFHGVTSRLVQLASTVGWPDEDRLRAFEMLKSRLPAAGLAELAGSLGRQRLEAALTARWRGNCDDELESLATEWRVDDEVRVRAAIALHRNRPRRGREVLRAIAADVTVSPSIRRRAAERLEK